MSDDLTRSFNGSVDEKLDRILKIVGSMDSRLLNLETRVATIETTAKGTESRLSSLEDKVDARLRETQPIWERVLTEITQLRTDITQLRKDMHLGLHKVERQIMQLSKDFLEHRADLVMLEDRIEKLEGDNV
jgi:chromosome segregation ATPase